MTPKRHILKISKAPTMTPKRHILKISKAPTMTPKRHILKVEGREIAVSNLDRVLFPKARVLKAQVIDYYLGIGEYLLPHLHNRPVTLKRYPDGVGGQFFYEKDAPAFTPDWVERFAVPRRGRKGEIHYILINDLATLVWVANTASLELHPFLHRVPRIDQPTAIVFDFDPGPGTNMLTCIQVAALVRDFLSELNLKCFAKVSGSKGLQLYVPLNTPSSYSVTQPFAKAVAQLMEQRHPSLIVSKMAKELRRKKVFIDWSQNSDFKTTIGVYSLRAKSETPYVSLPFTWDELTRAADNRDARSLCLMPEQALERVARVHDLFEPVLSLKQRLPSDLTATPARKPAPNASLDSYRDKRDFAKTPEPPPSLPARSAQGSRRRFVIQKHAASHLHYDFRLEMHGALKSWAVPKGPPFSTETKRLAMATEDHPLEYLDFEGVIPKGQYGGGTVMVWDIGAYELIEGNYYRGFLKFYLEGKKLKGEWTLVKSRDNGDARQNKWYLQKSDGSTRRASSKADDQSAISGRSMQEIAAAADRTWQSNRGSTSSQGNGELTATTKPADIDLSLLPASKLNFIAPMLAKPVTTPPSGSKWQFEIKLDGYRGLAAKKDGDVTLFSRRGHRVNTKFPGLASALEQLEHGTMLDGEVVALDAEGRPNFNALQHRKRNQPLYFYAFDLLAYKGKDLRSLPLRARRELLAKAVRGASDPIRLSPTFNFPVQDLVRAARDQGLEGIVAKRIDSVYEARQRSGAWVKYKTAKGQELVIGGYLPGPYVFDSLLVGYYEAGRLLFLAKIRNGFTPALRQKVAEKFKGLQTPNCPFANLPERQGARRGRALTKEVMSECRWLKPHLVAQVEFTDWTTGDHLRHSRFVALRDDKEPRDVTKESRVEHSASAT
jgi:bifunctional non-homologous end joining protein LigD